MNLSDNIETIQGLEKDLREIQDNMNATNKRIAELDQLLGMHDNAVHYQANKIYKKAIQQYLDCQTTNQWVDHFRKALKEATKQGGSVA